MRIMGIHNEAFIFNLDDREMGVTPTMVQDLDAMYTPNGFMLHISYGDDLADMFDDPHTHALGDPTHPVNLAYHMSHDGILHAYGKHGGTENVLGKVDWRRVLYGPNTRRHCSTNGGMTSDTLWYLLDICEGDYDRAFDAYCNVVSMDRTSLIRLPFTDVQAKLVELGYTEPNSFVKPLVNVAMDAAARRTAIYQQLDINL